MGYSRSMRDCIVKISCFRVFLTGTADFDSTFFQWLLRGLKLGNCFGIKMISGTKRRRQGDFGPTVVPSDSPPQMARLSYRGISITLPAEPPEPPLRTTPDSNPRGILIICLTWCPTRAGPAIIRRFGRRASIGSPPYIYSDPTKRFTSER